MNVAAGTLACTDATSDARTRGWRFVFDCWRQITLKQLLVVNLIALLIDVWFVLTWFRKTLQAHSWQPLAWAVGENAMIASGMLLVIAIADRVEPRRWPWWTPYAIGALLGGVVVNLLTTWCFELIPLRTLMDYSFDPAAIHRKRTMIEVTDGVVTCGVALFAYAWLRRLRQQQARLHAVQQQQVIARRRLAEARLQTMQGRVDPKFLIDTLARIEWLQGVDTARALHALNATIVYLRTVMPREQTVISTLGGELALTRAWLEVLRTVHGESIALEIALPDGIEAAAFPAMVLPCVVQHEVESALRSTVGPAVLRIEADPPGAYLLVRVHGIAIDRSAPDDDRIESLCVRLAALYGDRARFTRQRQVDGDHCHVETVIEIPR